MFRAILFDFAGVLTTSPFAGIYDYEAAMGYPRGSLRTLLIGDYGATDNAHPWHRLERGELTTAEFWSGLVERAEEAGTPIELQAFLQAFAGSVRPHQGMLETARGLRGAYKTAIVTNNVREFGDSWRSMIDAETGFDAVVDSSEVGMRKPEPAIYLHACELLEVAPDEAVFLDDSVTNVDAAVRLGLAGILVEDHEVAIAELLDMLGIGIGSGHQSSSRGPTSP